MKKKAFFFLRHNNDIDHVVPVIHKWLSNENIETDVIISYNKNLLEDYRVKYLRSLKNVNIYFISELLEKYSKHKFFYTKIYNFIYSLYKFHKTWLLKKFLFEKQILEIIDKKLFNTVDEGIVVFDWTANRFRHKIVKLAKKHGLVTISLPHGDEPSINYMIYNKDLKYDFSKKDYSRFKVYDYVVVPNQLIKKKRYLSFDQNKIKVLGSARFSDEWLDIIPKIRPSSNLDYAKDKIKILLFLRPPSFPIFWDEVARTIKLISKFPNTYLIVNHHPRGGGALKELRNTRNILNVRHVITEIPSENLMDWADLIIDVGGTSAVWGPIKKGKPVLMPEYLHANYGTVSSYISESEIKHRDELYNFLIKFTDNKNLKFYNTDGRKKFIKEIIDVPDENVLENYYNFLKDCLIESSRKKK